LQLQDFDKDHISDRTLKKISTYTTNEEFDPDKVGSVSLAAKFLCLWVIAMEKYGKIYRYLLLYVMNIFIFIVPGPERGE